VKVFVLKVYRYMLSSVSMSVLQKTSVRITEEEKSFLQRNHINASSIFREFLEYYIKNYREVQWKN
jgi:hypothetical protein